MFGRRFTRTGWLQLGALAFAVLAVLFLIFAPVGTVSIGLDFAPAQALPMSFVDWGMLIAIALVALSMVGVLIWLVVWTARKIIRAQTKSDAGESP